jgi:hypothetical protein
LREHFESTDSPSPIFSAGWWLDVVAPKSWDEIIVEQDGFVIARMPFTITTKFGLTVIRMPPLTQTLGPWLSPPQGKLTTRLSREHELLEEIIKRLPFAHYFEQRFHYSLSNWLPFYWNGFRQTTLYTYVIEDLTDLDAVWAATRDTVKSDIRKARKRFVVRADLPIDVLLDLAERSFRLKQMPFPYSRDLVVQLEQACRERSCRQMFFAEDGQNRICAAIMIVWDAQSAYYLLGAVDRQQSAGATSLLLWEAIQFAAHVTRRFDFEGSMIRSIEAFFRSFGATQKSYFRLDRASSRTAKLMIRTTDWWRARYQPA